MSENRTDFINGVIYQILTDRFFKPTNYETERGTDLNGYIGGSWKGIIAKIEDGYFSELGVSALWISPPVENVSKPLVEKRQSYFPYHGYWAKDFFRPNPQFGTLDDFDQLIGVAHQKNIKIIIDFAPHHTSPAVDGNQDFMEDGQLLENGQYIASYNKDDYHYYHHNGSNDKTYEGGIYRSLYNLASLNLSSPFISDYLKRAAEFWIKRGVDGIRLDGVRHMPVGWMRSYIHELYSVKPLFIFGEWFLGPKRKDSKVVDFTNNSGMSLLDFPLSHQIRGVLRDNKLNWKDFWKYIQSSEQSYIHSNEQVTFLDNHDMGRFTRKSKVHLTDLGLVLLITNRGIPCIYYGTEQYMEGEKEPLNRSLMEKFNRDTAAYKIIRHLSALRVSNSALIKGATQAVYMSKNVYVYERVYRGNVVLVAINKGKRREILTNIDTKLPPNQYIDQLNGLVQGKNLMIEHDGRIGEYVLEPYEAAVWQYKSGIDETPIIQHIYPSLSMAGNVLKICGEYFGHEIGKVKLGNKNMHVVSWNNQTIHAIVPNEITPGKHEVVIQNTQNGMSESYTNVKITSGKQICIRVIVYALTMEDEELFITGSSFELSTWQEGDTIGPLFNRVLYKYPNWYYDLSVPIDQDFEFQLVKKDFDGTIKEKSKVYYSKELLQKGTNEIKIAWERKE